MVLWKLRKKKLNKNKSTVEAGETMTSKKMQDFANRGVTEVSDSHVNLKDSLLSSINSNKN